MTPLASSDICRALNERFPLCCTMRPAAMLTAVLETIPPKMPDNQSPSRCPNRLVRKYPTKPMLDTRMTICQMRVGFSWNSVYSRSGSAGRMIAVITRNFRMIQKLSQSNILSNPPKPKLRRRIIFLILILNNFPLIFSQGNISKRRLFPLKNQTFFTNIFFCQGSTSVFNSLTTSTN